MSRTRITMRARSSMLATMCCGEKVGHSCLLARLTPMLSRLAALRPRITTIGGSDLGERLSVRILVRPAHLIGRLEKLPGLLRLGSISVGRTYESDDTR